MLSDRKIKLLKAKHGLIGYAVYLRLLEELYQDKGYYLEINEDFNILFSDDNNLDLNVYILILNDCINHELFDIKIFEKYSILTSKRIQINYLTACERRKGIDIYSEYLLFDMEDANIKTDNVNILNLNANIGTQSKKKVKKEEKENNKDLIALIRKYLPTEMTKDKATADKKLPDILKQHSEDEIFRMIDRYKMAVVEKRKVQLNLQYVSEGTFWNGRYLTYTDSEFKSNPIQARSDGTAQVEVEITEVKYNPFNGGDD
jgi:hypothetical protein